MVDNCRWPPFCISLLWDSRDGVEGSFYVLTVEFETLNLRQTLIRPLVEGGGITASSASSVISSIARTQVGLRNG